MSLINNEFQIFIKAQGARCNLACSYCYYLEKSSLKQENRRWEMSHDLLRKYTSELLSLSRETGYPAFFSWHGGEPMLAGIDFFREAVALQKEFLAPGQSLINGIQTNGTLIDEHWARFFRDENFVVGISVDGPEEYHNRFRSARNGLGSFDDTVRGFRYLRDHCVTTEILCVVSRANVDFPLEVYRFLRDTGSGFITFLPLVKINNPGGDEADECSVPARKFGEFLCKIFDEWVSNDIGNLKVQVFEEALRSAFNQEHTLCIFRKSCGGVPVIEQNGDFYSCDHYVDREHLVGNILERSLASLLDDEMQIAFGRAKESTLPDYCRRCEVLDMCNGECPRNRFITTPEKEPGLNYLCPGYRMFFNHIRPFSDAVRSEWLKGR